MSFKSLLEILSSPNIINIGITFISKQINTTFTFWRDAPLNNVLRAVEDSKPLQTLTNFSPCGLRTKGLTGAFRLRYNYFII
jgi:hypothetical protein